MNDPLLIMQTVGEFLTECGARLAPFERARVGKLGCGVALAAIGAAIVALLLGAGPAGRDPFSWVAAFRFVVLAGLGSVIALYLVYAAVEMAVTRAVRRRIDGYLSEGGADLETLVKAADLRRGQIAGGLRLAALLRERAGATR
jgi:hypothetical protein